MFDHSKIPSKLKAGVKNSSKAKENKEQKREEKGKAAILPLMSLLVLFFLVFSFHVPSVFSQTNNLTPDQEAALRTELSQIEAEIQQQQSILTSKQGEAKSITRDISILDAQIKEAQLKIKAHNIAIDRLGKDITVKTQTISSLNDRISNGHASLSDILLKTNELDAYSTADVLLAKRNLTDFFVEFDTLGALQNSLSSLLDNIKTARAANVQEEQTLNQKRNLEIDTRVDVQAEERKVQASQTEKQRLLSLNKDEQKSYLSIISTKQKRADEIKNALFSLRDSASIKFGDALTYAKFASGATGVRPAFLLAVIQQESNLGQNVGSCYLTDDTTGAGTKSSGAAVASVMKPNRDVAPFLQITQALGRDPHHTLVSCPFSTGYGGAMGPAQFIASTWMLSKDRIGAAVGKAMPDPWNAKDAITASALYLSDLGANDQGYTAERNAACRYYSGRNCSGSNSFYGDQVMAKATNIQENMIDILQQS